MHLYGHSRHASEKFTKPDDPYIFANKVKFLEESSEIDVTNKNCYSFIIARLSCNSRYHEFEEVHRNLAVEQYALNLLEICEADVICREISACSSLMPRCSNVRGKEHILGVK